MFFKTVLETWLDIVQGIYLIPLLFATHSAVNHQNSSAAAQP